MMLAIFLVSLLAISAVSAADNATDNIVSVEETTSDVVKETTDEVVFIEDNCTAELDFDLLNGKGYVIAGNIMNFNVKELNTPYYDDDYYIIDYTDGKNTKEISSKWNNTYQYSYDLNLTANSDYNYTFYGHYHMVGHLHGQPWTYGLYTNSNLVLQGSFKTDNYGNIVDFVHDQHLKLVLSNYNNSCTIKSMSKPSIYSFNLNGVTLGLSIGKKLLMGNNIIDEYYIGNNYDENYVKKVFNIFVHDNSNVRTFRELAAKINRYEFVLDCDYRYDATVDSNYQNGITISSGIIIDGKGHVIDGNAESKIFRINANAVLKNITFTNVLSSSSKTDGAIYWTGYHGGTIENCRFTNISVKYGAGLIHSHCKNLTIDSCYFENNYAKDSLIELYGYYSIINNCTFINNSNEIIKVTSFAKYSQISNCLFINNNGTCIGCGAIECKVINCSLVNNYANEGVASCGGNGCLYKNCSFINNSALYSGGAIFWAGHEGRVSDCIFINNTVTNSIYWSNAHGGAIFWGGDDGTLENCIFINNSASKYAGAISWTGEYGHVNNCIFINNTPNSDFSDTTIISKKQLSFNSSNYVFNYTHSNPISIIINNMSDNLQIISPINIEINNGIKNKKIIAYAVNDVVRIFDEISDLDVGNWTVNAIFEGDDNYYSCNVTFIISINPLISSLTITSNDTNLGKETILIANICDKLNSTVNEGQVMFYDGETSIGEANVYDGVATLIYIPSTAGEHSITAIFNSDNYLSSNSTVKLLVDNATVDVLVNTGTVGYNSTFVANVKGLYSVISEGTVSFYIDDEYIGKVNVVDGSASLVYSPLIANEYIVKVVFSDSVNFLDAENITSYTVNKADSNIVISSVNGTVGHELSLIAGVISSNNLTINEGIITFFDGETKIGESVVNGSVACLTYTPTVDGEHKITTVYDSSNYLSSNSTVSLLVDSVTVEVLVNTGTVGYNSTFVANVKGLYSIINEGTVRFYINDNFLGKSKVINGATDLIYIPLIAGNHIIKAVYGDSQKYLDTDDVTGYQVNKADSKINIDEITSTFGDELTLRVTIVSSNNLSINEGIVTFFDGETNIGSSNINDGVASLRYSPIAGEHKITVKFNGNNYLSSEDVSRVIVNKAVTKIIFDNVNEVYYNAPSIFNLNVLSDNNKINEGIVKFYIENKEAGQRTVTDKITFDYIAPKAGNFEILAVFEGTNNYLSSNAIYSFKVNKMPTIISASAVSTVYNGGKYLVMTLKDQNGNALSNDEISINLNGIKNIKTDSNGQVKLSTNGLAPKSYSAIITFGGNDNYDNSTSTVKVTVKKATPKLTAKAKTFKKSVKTKKYSITLKTNQNKVMKNTKLTLKVNGKTYKATTNTKGQATFKITKLTKKGKFTAVVKFAGNKYYNAKTVKPKITVK